MMPLLKDLIYGVGTYQDLRDTHGHLTDEEYDNLVKEFVQEIEAELHVYIDSLPYPSKKEDLYNPSEIFLMPEHVRVHVIEFLDNRIDDTLLVEKVMLYMNICQDIMTTILDTYEQRWKASMIEHGLVPKQDTELLDTLIKNN